jgi:hypothetical protein
MQMWPGDANAATSEAEAESIHLTTQPEVRAHSRLDLHPNSLRLLMRHWRVSAHAGKGNVCCGVLPYHVARMRGTSTGWGVGRWWCGSVTR